ncbi:MAG: DUF2339 domain-containing protein [Ignavibacteriales bacterium]|nr:DUF2339 domain-containing protein [Ignavibacteriales bacterium]
MQNYSDNSIEARETIKALEARLDRIENYLRIPHELTVEENIPQMEAKTSQSEEDIEMRIGQFWLPKIGVTAFLIGIAFFLTLPLAEINTFIPPFGTYLLAVLIVIISLKLKKSYPELSGYLFGGSAGIAFIATLRMHFFANVTLIQDVTTEFALLALVAVSTLAYGIKIRSIYIICLGILFGYIGALITDSPFVLIPVIIILSILQVILSIRYEWKSILAFGIIFSNFFHLTWTLNNPFIGKPLEIVKTNEGLVVFLLLYSLIFSIGILKRKNNQSEEFADTIVTLLNSVGSYCLFLVLTLMNSSPVFPFYHLFASAMLLGIACTFWIKERSEDMTYVLTMIGYAALSVSIVYQFKAPDNFILLCFQSLLVLSTAIWFRSKFIIMTNFAIFIGTLGAYLMHNYNVDGFAFCFGVVGLLSARLLNWKKGKLEFSTEKIRNGYLFITLILFPYAFYWVLPSMFAGLALLALALLYFGFSKLLHNIKYRYMSVLTLVISAGYLIILGFTNAEAVDKITSFIAAGIVLILISSVYSRIKRAG